MWKEIAFNYVLHWRNPLYLEGGDLFTASTSSSIFLPCSAEFNKCVTCLSSTAQILCRASWHPVWVKWGREPFAFHFCILLLREKQHGHEWKRQKERHWKLNMDYLFEGGSESELKRKRVENFPGKTFLVVAGTNVTINFENWGMEQDRELYTFLGLPIYSRSLFSADFWENHSPCAMEMSWLSKH